MAPKYDHLAEPLVNLITGLLLLTMTGLQSEPRLLQGVEFYCNEKFCGSFKSYGLMSKQANIRLFSCSEITRHDSGIFRKLQLHRINTPEDSFDAA